MCAGAGAYSRNAGRNCYSASNMENAQAPTENAQSPGGNDARAPGGDNAHAPLRTPDSPWPLIAALSLVTGMAIGYVFGNLIPLHGGGSSGKGIAADAPAPQAPPAAQGQGQPPPSGKLHRVPVTASMPIRGAKNAKVTIVEFSDFQCPFCGKVEPALKQALDEYPNDVRIVWRNFPLPFHDHAMEAAEAAMAADAQGKFWPMHDKLFANQQALDRASLDRYASEIGLDMAKFKGAMDSHTYKDGIMREITYGGTLGVTGTPGFFIDGDFKNGAAPYPAIKQVIDAEIAKANAMVKAGTPADQIYEAEMKAIPE
jgi:protein-disulfide isomerase